MQGKCDLNLKQLKVFYHVAAHMNFTKAAAELFITQSAVTKAMDSLEEYLGTRLFVRQRQQLSLTEAGLVLQTFANRIYRLATEAEEAVSSLAVNPGGVLRIGTTKTFARHLMPTFMIGFHEACPLVRIQMSEGTSNEMVQAVVNGHVDVAVVGRVPYPEAIDSHPFPARTQDPLVVVMTPGHRLAARERVLVSDLRLEPLLLRETGSGMRAKVMELFGKEGIVPNIVLEAANVDFTKELIRRGAGIGILGLMSVEEELREGIFKAARLGEKDLSISIDMIVPREGYRSHSTRSFVDFILGGKAKGNKS